MKYASILFIVLFLLFTGFIMSQKKQRFKPSEADMLVTEVLEKSAMIISKNFKIRPCGEGAAMPDNCVKLLTLCFSTNNRLCLKELRDLLIKFANELLNQINNNGELQKYLVKKPFTIENVQIIIYNHDENGGGLVEPEISTAQISNGILDYRTIDREDVYKLKIEFKESYEEALKCLMNK